MKVLVRSRNGDPEIVLGGSGGGQCFRTGSVYDVDDATGLRLIEMGCVMLHEGSDQELGCCMIVRPPLFGSAHVNGFGHVAVVAPDGSTIAWASLIDKQRFIAAEHVHEVAPVYLVNEQRTIGLEPFAPDGSRYYRLDGSGRVHAEIAQLDERNDAFEIASRNLEVHPF